MLIPGDLGARIIMAATLAAELHTQADSENTAETTQYGRRPQTGRTGWDQVMEDMPPGIPLPHPIDSASHRARRPIDRHASSL
jgi:hypothetical protein